MMKATKEEIRFWEMAASAALADPSVNETAAGFTADLMLEERRKRFPVKERGDQG